MSRSSDSIDEQPASKKARTMPHVPRLIQFSFLKGLLLPLLTDYDVLNRFAATGKCVLAWLDRYTVRSTMYHDKAIQLATDTSRIVSVTLSSVSHVNSLRFDDLPHIREVRFHWNFNQPTSIGSIPNTVRKVRFGKRFNGNLVSGSIPNSVTQVHFEKCFDQRLSLGIIPSSVTKLLFEGDINHPLAPGVIPESVRSLEFWGEFNHPLQHDSLPRNLTKLGVYCLDTDPIFESVISGCLPDSLTHLDMRYGFEDIPIAVLPRSLKKLHVGIIHSYLAIKKPFASDAFPAGLTHLHLTSTEYLKVGDVLPFCVRDVPASVTHLILDGILIAPVDPGCFPPNLLHLELTENFNEELAPGVLPLKLAKLSLGASFLSQIAIPSSVRHVKIHNPVMIAWLPPTVTHLTFCGDADVFPGVIPSSITHLSVEICDLVPGGIPPSVTHLRFLSRSLPQGMDDSIPDTVQSITLSNRRSDFEDIDFNASLSFNPIKYPRKTVWYEEGNPGSYFFCRKSFEDDDDKDFLY